MRHINKKLAFTAAAAALTAVVGIAVAQTPDDEQDPMATPQQVDVTGSPGQHIYFFHDQGNAPENDPAAHVLLIKHDQLRQVPVADTTTTTTTTVAQATTPADTTPAPAVVDTTPAATSTDTTAMPADTTPALAPKADRN
jgi:hypothetical protein